MTLAQRGSDILDDPLALDTLGWVQFQRGELDEAVTTYRQVLATSGATAGVRYRLGLALAKRGDEADALQAFREAIDSGPFPEADAARARIAQLEQNGAGPQ